MAPGGDDERALIARAQGGDTRAFEELVRRHADRLHAAARRWGLDEADAQDVAQETFVRAWRSLPGFRAQSQFYTWLYRIGFNETQRRLARRPPAEAVRPGAQDELERVADPGSGPQDRLAESELRGALERELRTLPLALRAPVVLRDIEGLSTAEAASVLDLKEAAFKSRLHRGRMLLRGALAPHLVAHTST